MQRDAPVAAGRVFVSHAFDDAAEVRNVTDWLDQVGVDYWHTDEVAAAAPLREQLRHAVRQCGVCVFVATDRSVESAWCAVELGAFWGAGVPIVVYLADPTVDESRLPPVVQGDAYERNLRRTAERAKELAGAAGGTTHPTARVGSLTVDELQKLLVATVSLVRAEETRPGSADGSVAGEGALDAAADQVARAADAASGLGSDPGRRWERRILWVDDRPHNNDYERATFESLGFEFELATSTDQALAILARTRFGAIISDMGRVEGPREGYALLDAVRARDLGTPFFIYASSRAPEHRREAASRGAQGTTNRPGELVEMVTSHLQAPEGRPRQPDR